MIFLNPQVINMLFRTMKRIFACLLKRVTPNIFLRYFLCFVSIFVCLMLRFKSDRC